MKNDDYKERLQQAALEGVIDRLENDQAFYVVRLMSKCLAPEAVYESKRVKELALAYLKEGFNRYNLLYRDTRVKTTAELMKAVKVPEKEVFRAILDYFGQYTFTHKSLPRDFEAILSEFSIPVDELNKYSGFQKAAITEINSNNAENVYARQLCFLKYFSLPPEVIISMVRKALYCYASFRKDESQLDKFIEATGFSCEQIQVQLTMAIADLVSEGKMEEVEVLVKKYEYPMALLISESNKKLAIEGVLKLFDSRKVEGTQRIIDLFALTKDDFEESALVKTVESSLSYRDLKTADSIMTFAGLSNEKKTALIRRKLEWYVLAGAENVRSLTDKYGIAWSEVVTAAENAVVSSLAGSHSKYIKEIADGYGLPKEFLASERVVNAAKEGLVKVYEMCDYNDDVDFLVGTFGLKI